MHFTNLATLALALTPVANAGSVVAHFCSSGQLSRSRLNSMLVFYDNKADGCENLSTFVAKTGVITPFLGLKKFCNKNGFCGNMEVFGKSGLHVSLDGKEVALGSPDKYVDDFSKEMAGFVCRLMGIYDDPYLSVSTWDHAPKTKCR
jgi:hypothetical protein